MSQLEQNTAALQALLEAVNALPEAGGDVSTFAAQQIPIEDTYSITFSGLPHEPKMFFVMRSPGVNGAPEMVDTVVYTKDAVFGTSLNLAIYCTGYDTRATNVAVTYNSSGAVTIAVTGYNAMFYSDVPYVLIMPEVS